jgi:carbamoyl-phosphate synthase/aspartate carbamoyltransferase/dihydroorotase
LCLMSVIRLPALVDVHVHTREPGQTHKEDWSTATASALAGGISTVLAMPNTVPVAADGETLEIAERAAGAGARCDFGLYAGATGANSGSVRSIADRVVGLKMFLDQSFGDLRLPDLDTWWDHLAGWPESSPIVVHAEGRSLPGILLMAGWLGRQIHVCHVSRPDELNLIARAKDRGLPVTCEVAPHHLFLDATDAVRLGRAGAVRPPLASPEEVKAMWERLEVIDCFATDHAPHTAAEKASDSPPPGYPGVETMLPLLLTAVSEGRLSLAAVVERLSSGPRRIFGLREPDESSVEVDPDDVWVIRAAELHTRCDWTPYEGREVRGRVTRVVLRGDAVYADGMVTGSTGTGRNVREEKP